MTTGFGGFVRSLNNKPWGYEKRADPTGSAPTEMVEVFEVRPGDCGRNAGWDDCANDRERSELRSRRNFYGGGTEYWYGWSIYFPEDHPNIHQARSVYGQFHQRKGGKSSLNPAWMVKHLEDGLYLDNRLEQYHKEHYLNRYDEDNYELIPEEELRGKWHRFEIHAKWTSKNSGFFHVYVNGKQKCGYNGPTMSYDQIYFKYGIYRSKLHVYKSWNDGKDAPGQIVYYANVKIGKKREELLPTYLNK